MSGEKFITSPEHQSETHESQLKLPEYHDETVAELLHEQPEQKLEAARQAVEQAEQQTEAARLPANESESSAVPVLITAETRQATLTSSLKHIRRRLPLAERGLSRIVHQPAVKAVSELGSKTVSRPSGLLGGGICAFLGSASYLYLAKHIGFRYNYLLFILFFAGGFVAGLAIELLLLVARPRRSGR